MTTISFENASIPVLEGQSVLDALLRQGVDVPHACRAGVCKSCLVQAKTGKPPASAQIGLKNSLREQNYFLSCSCFPEQDLVLGKFETVKHRAIVETLVPLSPRVLEVGLCTEFQIEYRAGQYITLHDNRTDGGGVARCYSLSSNPDECDLLTIQVARVEGGKVSSWIHDQFYKGQEVYIQQPLGDCVFEPTHPGQPILLAGNGTGLAPLYGILKDALSSKHLGEIHLFHRAATVEELYLDQTLKALAERHSNFNYHPSTSECSSGASVPTTTIETMISDAFSSLNGWQTYFCGNPKLVHTLRKQSYLKGASLNQIFSDAFVNSTN